MRIALTLLTALAVTACGRAGESDTAGDVAVQDMLATQQSDAAAAMGDTAPLPEDETAPAIEVRAAWIRPHPQGRDVTAAYFVARLTEGEADRFLEAELQGASHVEPHGHAMSEGGMIRMRPIGPQRITDEGPLVFTPGGRHLMVHGLPAVHDGETVEGSLTFELAGRIPVMFEVRSDAPAADND